MAIRFLILTLLVLADDSQGKKNAEANMEDFGDEEEEKAQANFAVDSLGKARPMLQVAGDKPITIGKPRIQVVNDNGTQMLQVAGDKLNPTGRANPQLQVAGEKLNPTGHPAPLLQVAGDKLNPTGRPGPQLQVAGEKLNPTGLPYLQVAGDKPMG